MQRGCNCYHMTHRHLNLALVHSIQVINNNEEDQVNMLSFSSIEFSELYLDTYLPLSINIRHLRMTNEHIDLLDHNARIVQCVNKNRGWTAVG
eukprot:12660152-Ditylum_brightwellii.AAC.1